MYLQGLKGASWSRIPALYFHDNPASRTSRTKTVFFPNTAHCAKILANPASE